MIRLLSKPLLSVALVCAGLSSGCGEKECPPAPPCPAVAAAPAPPPPPTIAAPSGAPSADALASTALTVDGDAGRNNFTAIFDAPLGERITANSSAVSCDVTYDQKTSSFGGTCKVPLTTITVDNDSTKMEHFEQWATNKKSDPKDCLLEAKFENVRLGSWLTPGISAKFAADVPFSVCGRARVDGGREHLEGTAMLLPPDQASTKTLRIRAQLDGFSRDAYRIGPAWTDGWLARVQKLANVVADKGTVTLSLFAQAKE